MSRNQSTSKKPNTIPNSRQSQERGVALLITLGLLALLGAASLAVIFLTSSDTMINGYYKNYRGSFYAADSGVNVVVAAIKNSLAAAANPTAAGAPLPVQGTAVSPGNTGSAIEPPAVTAALAPYLGSYYNVGDTGSWNSQFKLISASIVTPPGATYMPTCNGADPNCAADGDYVWTYTYPFQVVVQGQSSGSEVETLTETFQIQYSSTPGSTSSGGLPSFSKWAGFIDQYTLCDAGLVPGTMYGPFFTNGSWNFGNYASPGYTFENSIGQAGSQVGYVNGRCTPGGLTPPAGFNAPRFVQGFTIGDPAVTEPTDSYNQEEAVLDGKGAAPCSANPCVNGDRTPPSSTLMSTMQTASGVSYPSSGTAPAGVYLPMYTNSTTGQLTFGSDPALGGDGYGGGFYVNGDASISLSATTATTGDTSHPTQTYTISQTSGSGRHTTTTTTTIVVDTTAGTTSVTQGSGAPLVLQGVPTQVNPNTGASMNSNTDPGGDTVSSTMVYVNGQVTGLSGTVQNANGTTITATSDVDVTGNITYASPVVNSSDQLVSTTNAGVLGIYTQGNINLEPSSNGGNLTIDASLAMIGSGTSGLETPDNSVGTLTIMGGRSEDQAHSVSMSASNTMYDQRFAGNFGPPWFPTAQPTAGTPTIPSTSSASIRRISWAQTSR